MTEVEKARLTGWVEAFDYVMNTFCIAEIPEAVRLHLRNRKFALNLKINDTNNTENKAANSSSRDNVN